MNIIRAVGCHNSGKSAPYFFFQDKLRVTRRIASHLGGTKVANGFGCFHFRCFMKRTMEALFDKVANRRLRTLHFGQQQKKFPLLLREVSRCLWRFANVTSIWPEFYSGRVLVLSFCKKNHFKKLVYMMKDMTGFHDLETRANTLSKP